MENKVIVVSAAKQYADNDVYRPIVLATAISNKFKPILMQNVDFAQFQQNGIISFLLFQNI